MRRVSVAVLAMVLAFASAAFGAQKIEDIPWDEAHIKQLRAEKHAVFRFFDQQQDPENDMEWNEDSISWDYAWYPAGDGKYELAIHSNSGPDISYLTIYWQDARGKIITAVFPSPADASDAWYWEENGPELIDANGDGKTEVISLASLDYPPPHWSKFIPGGVWPQVYQVRNGKYVEASRDFGAFYDKTIFPLIDKAMAKAQQEYKDDQSATLAPNIDPNEWRIDSRRKFGRTSAELTMCRDKILRVLGRDPSAGLAQAREWMKSPDPVMVVDARNVFLDIGRHDDDVRAATAALATASKNWGKKPW